MCITSHLISVRYIFSITLPCLPRFSLCGLFLLCFLTKIVCAFLISQMFVNVSTISYIRHRFYYIHFFLSRLGYYVLMCSHSFQTLLMDQARFTELGNRFFRLAVMGSILLVTTGTALALQGVAAFKNKLKGHITVLLEDCYTNK